MSKQLPERPNLEHLKNEAKALLRLAKTNDPEALARMGQTPAKARLTDSQLAIAREYGYPSWSKLKRYVEGYETHRNAFFAAIKAGDRERVRKILAESPDVIRSKDPTEFGATPMIAAVNREDRPMIDLLLEHGADVNAKSDWWAGGFGPLDSASEEISNYLISKGAKLTAHAAARLGKVKELKAIIAKDPNVVHERGGDGQYPLHFSKTPEIAGIILDAGADIDARDLDHHGTAAQFLLKNEEVLRYLVERGASTDIFMAVALEKMDLLKWHVEEDAGVLERPINEPGSAMIPVAPGRHIYSYVLGGVTPLQAAANLDRELAYQFLFDRSPPRLQLLAACWKGDGAVARRIVAENPDMVANLALKDKRLICDAAWNRKADSVKLMLELGFDVNTLNGERLTPIANGAFHGFDDIVELILPYGPDLEIKNVYGGTPLGTCTYGSVNGWRKDGNYPRTVELLIKAGAKLPESPAGSPEVREVLAKYM
ncbi:MAG: ankyrin repeat domain-containing protein [Fimbriimonadaceae bacterium]|nr:ankyrin repeat domain-containing protein [Fimbriimonadaceae bacterium]